MRKLNLPNVSLMALVISFYLQLGAQLFALSVVARTVSKAPPRSFAILQGEYRYDSRAFWETVPPITGLLFVIALVANWRTSRRRLLLISFALFVVAGLMAGIMLEPEFARMVAAGSSDTVDPVLQSRAARWYALDWAVWCVGLFAGIVLLVALSRPVLPAGPKTE